MDLDKTLSGMSINDQEKKTEEKVIQPRSMPPRLGGRSVLPPMSRPSGLPPMSGSPRGPLPGGMRNRPGAGRMGKPALNLSQLGLSPKPEQTPFSNFSKYVYVISIIFFCILICCVVILLVN